MLTATEIEMLIKQHKPLPAKSDYFEKFYYFALDMCVELYKQNKLSKEDLREYRLGYKEIYEQLCLWLKLLQKHRNIEKALYQVELGNCDKCKRVARLLDGREDCE